MSGKRFSVGIYEHEDNVKAAVKTLQDEGVKIHEVYSPYAIHGMEDVLGYKLSRLPKAAFLFGLTGTTLGLSMLYLMMGYDWPMIIGGKNFAALPPFIPVTFEITVLLASFGMVFTFFVASDLKPGGNPKIFDHRITLDKFAIVVDLDKNTKSKSDIEQVINKSGASEVNEKNFSE